MGGGDWVAQFSPGFLSVGAILGERRILPRTGEPSFDVWIRASGDSSEKSPEGRRARASSGKSPRDSELWEDALVRVGRGWIVGPPGPSREAAPAIKGEPRRRNPSPIFGVSQGEKLG